MSDTSRKRNTGVVLVCVLVCMGIASAIVLTSVRMSLRTRRQMRAEIQLEQTRWLLEAGLVRAVKRLREQPDYAGEMWDASEALTQYDRARVSIDVQRDAASAGTARLILRARVGRQAPGQRSTQRSRTVVVDVNSIEPQQP